MPFTAHAEPQRTESYHAETRPTFV
ncbi:protein of unknown function [Alcaligenes faecalis subsp. faecalis]|nr:protein of unknown function [Alcaligenes faecalis subsp. faecalis]